MNRWMTLLMVLITVLSAASAFAAKDGIDLDKAVKIGNGKTTVIEFTDPDCPFCRKAEAYFMKRADVTRYVFFIPLKTHPMSREKIQYILSAKDKAKAYHEATSDTFDKRRLSEITPAGVKLQKEHEETAKANKMNATPTFMIYGRIVEGFDLKKLEQLLK